MFEGRVKNEFHIQLISYVRKLNPWVKPTSPVKKTEFLFSTDHSFKSRVSWFNWPSLWENWHLFLDMQCPDTYFQIPRHLSQNQHATQKQTYQTYIMWKFLIPRMWNLEILLHYLRTCDNNDDDKSYDKVTRVLSCINPSNPLDFPFFQDYWINSFLNLRFFLLLWPYYHYNYAGMN